MLADSLYGKKKSMFRRTVGNTRVTIYNGGHEMIHLAALNWLSQQRKGKPAVWKLKETRNLETTKQESESGK